MYTFIRHELDVPFYNGQLEIDVWLNRILVAIQSRTVEGTLVDVFTPVNAWLTLFKHAVTSKYYTHLLVWGDIGTYIL